MTVMETWRNQLHDWLPNWPDWTSSFLLAIIIVVGFLAAKWFVKRGLVRILHHPRRPRPDPTAEKFILRVANGALWFLGIVGLFGAFGVDTAALAGGLAVGGFVIGFALKDLLANLAAGVILLINRPFNVRDTVTIATWEGDVVEIGLAMTVIQAADGRIISVPNGKVLSGSVVNHTRFPRRRADVIVDVEYGTDLAAVKTTVLNLLEADPQVLAEPAPDMRITDLGASGVRLQVRPWVPTPGFWGKQSELRKDVLEVLQGAGFVVSLPQTVVHLQRAEESIPGQV